MKRLASCVLVVACAAAAYVLPTVGVAAAEEGDPAPRTPDAWVEEALSAAGANAEALRAVLQHYEARRDARPRRYEAARFLIANMPGHGYIVTRLEDAEGNVIPYDPLAYETFAEARDALEAVEREHGEVEFQRDRRVEDVETVTADFLISHLDHAFAAWEAVPAEHRISFDAFLEHVLPYRGSQEPVELWIAPLRERYGPLWDDADSETDLAALRKRVSKDVHRRVRFNERYYLHPTDQGFSEMEASGQGRCEDITNMLTYAMRSLAIATAADYTPAWAHRDNNHAWNVLLDREGRGYDPSNAHAAKVYRKTYAIQRRSLPFLLPEGREAPNRFLASRFAKDVTDQYGPTSNVDVPLFADAVAGEDFVYACVFNGGRWVAIDWAFVRNGYAVFAKLGRGVAYLPAVHRAGELVPAGDPFLLERDGAIRRLEGEGKGTDLIVTAVRPRQRSVDTHVETPVSYLKEGTRYTLKRWSPSGWVDVTTANAAGDPLTFASLPADGLYWMVAEGSRRLERIFTIADGRQRWW